MTAIKKEHLVNREVSWLHFNERVLQEAMDKNNPIIERLKFLGIFSNNRDEFFRVRVATVKRLTLLEKEKTDTATLRLQPSVKARMQRIARIKGINFSTLARMWIIEKLNSYEQSPTK